MVIPPYTTPIEALDGAPPERVFATMWEAEDEVESVTFGDFRRWSEAQASVFHAHGLRAGDRVVLGRKKDSLVAVKRRLQRLH